MKLRAQISIDVDADDYIAAADYQCRFEKLIDSIKSEYPNSSLELRECRSALGGRTRRGSGFAPSVRHATGALSVYEDIP